MKRPFILAAALLLASPLVPAQAPEDVYRSIIRETRGHSLVMRHLHDLVEDIGPRLTSSEKLQEACEWAVERFKSFGITNAHLEQWGTFPVGFDRGVMTGRMIVPEEMRLDITTPAWSPGTEGSVRAAAIRCPATPKEVEAAAKDLKDKWALLAARPGRGTNLKVLAEALESVGAKGLLYASRGRTDDLVITSGNYRISWNDLPTFPRILLRKDQVEHITALMDDGKTVQLEFDIDNRFREGPIPLYNVIADIPGTEWPDEYVIMGGHIDSWDGATGTTDNGTGVATTLEAARVLMKAGVRPKRTIRFMLWSGEEQGLMGSRAWIKAHPEMLDKISAVIVHDGGTNHVSGITVTPTMQDDMEKVFLPIMRLSSGLPFEIKVSPEGLPAGIGSDHDAFLSAGVPGFFWHQAGRANYTHTHHTQFDTFDQAIPEYQRHTAMVIGVAAVGLANLDHLLDRTKLRAPRRRGGRRMLGVQLGDDLRLTMVVEGGAAAKAGLKVGDKIVSIEGKPIGGSADIREALRTRKSKLKVVYERAGKKAEATLQYPRRRRR